MENNKLWEEKYNLAKQYYEEHGNILIPNRYKINNINLGRWLSTQRNLYEKGKLSQYRIDKLNDIGMIWKSFKDVLNNEKWEERYALAKNYYEEHGDLLIPNKYVINGINLGIWLTTQRRLCEKNSLSEEKIDKLKKIGLIGTSFKNKMLDKKWEERYVLAKKYYEEHGDLLIPNNYTINGINLGAWIISQRRIKLLGKLSQNRINNLILVDMVWDLEKEKDINKINSKDISYEKHKLLLQLIINRYSNNLLLDLLNDYLEEDQIYKLNNLLKENMTSISYEIFMLYLLGLTHKKISKIYDISINEVEINRLNSFKFLFENINNKEKHKELEKIKF
ncbi:MAG: helicase associated domain-containing protein [Bacilli bacterium]|nr:helicase associated domain-containing protein [Bacilli bacterium]